MSKGRTRMTLQELLDRTVAQRDCYWKQNDPRRYQGLEECRKNVIKCNCAYKLKYCKPTTLN